MEHALLNNFKNIFVEAENIFISGIHTRRGQRTRITCTAGLDTEVGATPAWCRDHVSRATCQEHFLTLIPIINTNL